MATPMTKANKDIGELIKNEGKNVIATRNMWNLHQTYKENRRGFFHCKEIEKFKLDLRAKEKMYKGK